MRNVFGIRALCAVASMIACASQASAQTTPEWYNRFSLSGDMKFRTERIYDQGAGGPTAVHPEIWRNAVRARLAISAKVNDEVQANMRLTSTGEANTGNSANSSEQVLGAPAIGTAAGGPGKKAIDLDLAYFDYKPFTNMVFSGGKTPNAFWSAGRNELVYDADLTFEGASAKWAADMGMFKTFVNLSADYLQTRRTTTSYTPDAGLLGGQVGAMMTMARINATLAASYYAFTNIKNHGSLFDSSAPTVVAGNTVTGSTQNFYGNSNVGGAYSHDFRLLDIGLELGLDAYTGLPVTVYGDYVQNTSMGDSAYLGGVKVGMAKELRSWEVNYTYRHLDADSVIGGLTDSNFTSRAGVQGHKLGAVYQMWNNGNIAVSQSLALGRIYDRTQLDFNFAF